MNSSKKIPTIIKENGIVGYLLSLFNRPFPVMEDREMQWLVIGFHGIFVAAFLIFFRPFQDIFNSNNLLINVGFGFVVSIVLALNHLLISRVLPIDLKDWTIGKSILWTLYDIVSVIIGVFIYNNFWTNFENFTWTALVNIGSVTLLSAVIPVIISTILLENWLLRRNLNKARKMQQSVNNAAANMPSSLTNDSENILTLYSETKGEWLKIRPSDIIFLETTDNYVTIHFKEKNQIKKKLIRNTLTNIASQISISFIQRCHRSYMINLHQIQYVDGNSRGLQLQLMDMDKTIPVSRKYVKAILEKIDAN